MTGGGIAAIIAAVALMIFVGGLIGIGMKMTAMMNDIKAKLMQTIDETNTTIAVVTKDVDILSQQVEGLLTKSNELLEDVNQKVATLDPLFVAVADLSESVSDLNQSSKHLLNKVGSVGKTSAKVGIVSKVGGAAIRAMRSNKKTM